jgi:hypothetical protein
VANTNARRWVVSGMGPNGVALRNAGATRHHVEIFLGSGIVALGGACGFAALGLARTTRAGERPSTYAVVAQFFTHRPSCRADCKSVG